MAMLPSVFNTEGKGDSGFAVLDPGWYVGYVQKSTLNDTKSGTGKYLKIEVKIVSTQDGDNSCAGTRVWHMFNLVNPNPTAVEIAEREFASLVKACGFDVIEDSAEIHDIPFMMKLAIDPGTDQWPAKNVIKKFAPEGAEVSASNGVFDEAPF